MRETPASLRERTASAARASRTAALDPGGVARPADRDRVGGCSPPRRVRERGGRRSCSASPIGSDDAAGALLGGGVQRASPSAAGWKIACGTGRPGHLVITVPLTVIVWAFSTMFSSATGPGGPGVLRGPGDDRVRGDGRAERAGGAQAAGDTRRRPRRRPTTVPERLPPSCGARTIFAVEAEDHYLRLHTSAAGPDPLRCRTPWPSWRVSKGPRRTAPGGWRGTP